MKKDIKGNLQQGIYEMYSGGTDVNVPERRRRSSGTAMAGRRRKDDQRDLMSTDDIRTTLVLNRKQYAVIRAIAHNEGVTIKSIVSEMFRIGIELYEKKNGPVEPIQDKDVKAIF